MPPPGCGMQPLFLIQVFGRDGLIIAAWAEPGVGEHGGEGWIRTSVRLRGQIYSLLPLTTRPPLQVQAGAPCGEPSLMCQRD